MNGADLLVGELQKRGVRFIATLCGHGLDPLYQACVEGNMRLVDVRNEQVAGYMAEVTGRLTREVGVCAVSSGVAHVNALTGVLNAHFDGAPMLLITGCGPTETMRQGHFQDMDQVALASSICKYVEVIQCVEDISGCMEKAFTTALVDRPGPVHLTFPTDVQMAEVEEAVKGGEVGGQSLDDVDKKSVEEIVDVLAQAEKPLLIAGSGLYYAHGEAVLEHLVDVFPMPVMTPIWDRGSVVRPMDAFVGVIGAATGGAQLLDEADVILMLGARCDYRVGYLKPPGVRDDAKVMQVHADVDELRREISGLSICADPAKMLEEIARVIGERNVESPEEWLVEARSRRDAYRQKCVDASPAGEGMFGLDIVQAVQSVLTDETIFLIDGGNIGQWAHQMLCDRYPGHWLTCGASGVVGYGIPGAMAARASYPDRPIVLISGDGSLTFTVAEFETAARQGLNFVVVLADDEAWGITVTGHVKRYGQGISSELGSIDYVQMVEAFGARGVRIEKADEIAPAIREGFEASVPTLIHIPITQSNPAEG